MSASNSVRWSYILRISSTENGLGWTLCSAENSTIYLLSDLSPITNYFVIKDLAIRNGKNGQSIFVTNDSALDNAEEFSLIEVVNHNLLLRSWLENMLAKAGCKLDIVFLTD